MFLVHVGKVDHLQEFFVAVLIAELTAVVATATAHTAGFTSGASHAATV